MDTRTIRIAVFAVSGLTAAISLTVLSGWLFHISQLKRFVPGLVSMNPVTACTLIVASISLLLLQTAHPGSSRRFVGRLFAGVVFAIGALRLLSIFAGFDRWLFTDQLTDGFEPTSRIALRTAINLILTASALLLLDVQTRRGRRPTEFLCAVVAAIAALAIVGYSYGLFMYYRAPDFVPMSLPGAIAFLLLATGILLARPDRGTMAFITGNSAGGLLMRLLLPLALLLPVLLGALRLAGENAGWYSSRVGVALFATAFIILFLVSVLWTARLLFRAETERNVAQERVRHLNTELEERVIARTAELDQSNQELQRANKAKDDFLAALSHELRTPLTPVLISASSLENDLALAPEYREQMSMIKRNIELEARLIDDLLDLTRISRGKLELHISPSDMHSLLVHTEQIVRSEASGKSVRLHFALDAHEHRVSGDTARLHQVFWNILKNAIKFTPRGGEVTVKTSNPAPNLFRLEVCDTGVGMAPTLMSSIFMPFVQGEVSPGRGAGGLGLGLSISKKIIDLHGGTIRVESAGHGKGCTFTIELTTIASVLEDETNVVTPTLVKRRSYRLLLVEDHQPTLETLSRLLRKQGHQVVTAASVEAALAVAAEGGFDLVISDIGLPDGTGVDLMVELSQRYGLRGVAISGYGMEEDIARTKKAGFLAHLVKPIDMERLSRVIEQVAAAA